jgi:hypothetical protein
VSAPDNHEFAGRGNQYRFGLLNNRHALLSPLGRYGELYSDPYAHIATMRSYFEMQLAGPYGAERLGTARAAHSYRDCQNRMSLYSARKQRALVLGASVLRRMRGQSGSSSH